ncbi:hypothetical protein [Desulfonema magnum]|uniref:DUF3782 domain-containing protein n=1 Tax=Desulfonema magnum TaxID=45655 RepID=A0A975BGR7_9BACT|nr:hypothetical protein [Desulfonema magnum]QTA84760.1 Uncharacterized protein dnm_007600 [Desulfonema magnum]
MSANLQKQVDGLEKRTDSLESVLGQFIASMNKMMIRQEADTKAFKEEMRVFREDTDRTLTRMEADTRAFKEKTDATLSRMEADTKNLKAEMKAFKKEMRADRKAFSKEMRALKKETDKKWGELANRLGTVAEDIAAPNIPGVAEEYFGDSNFESFAARLQRRKSSDRNVRREFDVIGVADRHFFICEVKSNPRPEDVRDFVSLLEEVPDYFPESRERRVVPIFSSLHIPENILRHLTRSGIYAMAMRDDTMDLLNFEKVAER